MSSAILQEGEKLMRSVGKASAADDEELKIPRAVASKGGTSRCVVLRKNR